MAHAITLIPGDGIGPEVAEAAEKVLAATGVEVEWHRVETKPESLVADVVASIEKTKVGLKGPVTTPVGGGYQSVNVALRKKLDLYANVRPVKSMPGIHTRFDDVALDMVIFRENTEDLYSGLEHEVVPDVITSIKVITRTASTRIARAAFRYGSRQLRKRVTAIHKANIMKLADGLFLRCCREIAADYPHLAYNELIVDNASMQLVTRPEQFDILLLPNLYGDILSDLAAGLVGGLGVAAGANMGDNYAVFESVHGSAPDIAGQGKANPTALLRSSVMMLEYLKEAGAAAKLQRAIELTYRDGGALTPDVGGTGTTSQFTAAVIRNLNAA